MYTLVLLRHGESLWNKANRFTGWTDVDLTPQGINEATQAGQTLLQAGYTFDLAYTSLLKRGIRTLWLTLDAMDLMWIPVYRSWRLNERHYGSLQGLYKDKLAREIGEQQVHIWRRSFDISPPPLDSSDERDPGRDPRYAALPRQDLPATESLKDAIARVLPYWHETIAPQIRAGHRVIIAAHGNSLRGLVKHLDQISNDEVAEAVWVAPVVERIPAKRGGLGIVIASSLSRSVRPTARRRPSRPSCGATCLRIPPSSKAPCRAFQVSGTCF